jgi:hypothetical protein
MCLGRSECQSPVRLCVTRVYKDVTRMLQMCHKCVSCICVSMPASSNQSLHVKACLCVCDNTTQPSVRRVLNRICVPSQKPWPLPTLRASKER